MQTAADDDGGTLVLLCGAAICWRMEAGHQTRRHAITFETAAQFWDWLRSRLQARKPTWAWAMPASQALSLLRLWDEWSEGRFSLRAPARRRRSPEAGASDEGKRRKGWLWHGDRGLILRGWYADRPLTCLDLQNWLPHDSATLSSWAGKPAPLRSPAGLSWAETLAQATLWAETIEHCVLRIERLVRGSDLGNMRPTAAGQAFAHWRHLPMAADVVPPTCAGANRLARTGYHGGRAALFWSGLAPGAVHQLDVTGIYGSVMMHDLLPCKLVGWHPCPDPRAIAAAARRGEVCAAVKLDTRRDLPYLDTARQLSWARGRYWTVLCGAELARAVDEGEVMGWGSAARYALAPVCRVFAERWWAQRQRWAQEKDAVLSALAKAMPCYLYGRWALRRSEWVEITPGPDAYLWDMGWRYQAETRSWQQQRILNGVREVLVPMGESRWSMPAISAWITSAARVLMDRYRAIVGEGEVYHQAVDSLHVSEAGYRRLLDAGCVGAATPGLLRHERTYQQVEYLGRNAMICDGKVRCAGLPGFARRCADGTYQAVTWEGLAKVLDRGPDGTVRYRVRPYSLPAPALPPGPLPPLTLSLW